MTRVESLTYLASWDASRERLWSRYPQWFPDSKQIQPKMELSLVSESSSLYAHHLLRPAPSGSSAVQTSTPPNIIQAEIPFADTRRYMKVFPRSQDWSLICPLHNRRGSHLQDVIHMILSFCTLKIFILQTACFCSVSKSRITVTTDVFFPPLKNKRCVFTVQIWCDTSPQWQENNYTENLSWNRTD